MLLMAVLGSVTLFLFDRVVDAIIKQFVGDTAKAVKSEERIRGAFGWVGTRWRKRQHIGKAQERLSANGSSQADGVSGDN